MSWPPPKPNLIVGVPALLAGVLCHPWVLGPLAAPDGRIGNPGNLVILWIASLLLLTLGVPLVLGLFRLTRKRAIGFTISAVCSVLLFEVVLRVYAAWENAVSVRGSDLDERLGWRPRADADFTAEFPGFGEVRYTSRKHGFRRWGDPDAAATRVLAIGDSYTQALTVSDGETWYDRLAAGNPDTEWWAFGCGGYGTYQELLVLEEYAGEIRPDVVIWQLCSNDVFNNDPALERRSPENNLMTRPYLVDGEHVDAFPGNFLVRHSHILRRLHLAVNLARADARVDDDAALARSLATMRHCLERARELLPDAEFHAFATDRPGWLGDGFAEVAREAGFDYVEGVPGAIGAARERGLKVTGEPHDGHWNGEGHRIVAAHLAARIDRLAKARDAEAAEEDR